MRTAPQTMLQSPWMTGQDRFKAEISVMDRSAYLDAANQLMVASEETDDFVLALALGLAEGAAYLLNQATAI